MIICATRFNIYLLLLVTLGLAAGCKSPEKKQAEQRAQQLVTLRVHIEVRPEATGFTEPVTVFRAAPMVVNIQNVAVLTEAHVASARVIESHGGFSLRIQYNDRGTRLLEHYTAANPKKHLVIFSEFGVPGQARWLAAPLINRKISDGLLIFTPDATRDEAEQIAIGLNNVAGENETNAKP
jgi:preprotein translocase subunit SecD